MSNQTRNFEYVKEVAVARLEKTINDQLNILSLGYRCDYAKLEKLSKSVFSWDGKGFSKRRLLKNCVWVEVLKTQAQADSLNRFKLQTDLKEIMKFLKPIFQSPQILPAVFDSEFLIERPLKEAAKNLSTLDTLRIEEGKLKQSLRDHKFLIIDRFFGTRSSKEQRMLFAIEENATNARTRGSIQTRFEINWYRCQAEQARIKSDLEESCVQKEIGQNEFRIFLEQISGDAIRDTLYALAERYKSYIDVLQNSFDLQLDEIDSEINHKRLEISKLVEQRNVLRNQMEKFQTEIRIRLEKEEKRRRINETERLRLEEEVRKSVIGPKHKDSAQRRLKRKRKTILRPK